MPRLGKTTVVQQACRPCAETVNEFLDSGWQRDFSSVEPIVVLIGAFVGYKRLLLRRTALVT
jgi:hypothetical protein